jgi:anti-sigma-K factor RskA
MEVMHLTQEQADEYAIGALEPEVERIVALHVADCERCRDNIHASERLAASLALSVPLRKTPATLKRKVLLSTGIVRPGPIARIIRFVPAAAALAAVFVAIGAFTGMVSVRGQISDLRVQNTDLKTQIDDALSQKVEIAALTRRLSAEEKTSTELRQSAKGDRDLLLALLSPDSDVAEVISVDQNASAIGRLVWDEEQKRVWFVANKLPERPVGETYQIWVNSGGKYHSLGTFNSDGNGFARYETIVPLGLKSYESAVVTIERAGGAAERSGPVFS